MRHRIRIAAAALLLMTPALAAQAAPKKAAAKPAAPPPKALAIDKAAMDALNRSRAYLKTLTGFELRAEMTADEVEDGDLKLEVSGRARYDYARPDKLFIDWRSDRIVRQLFFDGKSATLFAPRYGYYASVQQPGTVADMLIGAARDYGVILPLPDLFLWAVRGAEPVDVQMAMVVGYARIAGVDTDQYVFRQADADWQVWIQRGDQPLPRKIAITARDDPAKPKFSALLQWNLNPTFADNQFSFTPPAGTAAVGFAKVAHSEDAK